MKSAAATLRWPPLAPAACSMRAMSRTLHALIFIACTTACSGDATTPVAAAAPSTVSAAKAGPTKPEPATDPILSKVCKAFDDVTAEHKGDSMLLSRTAVRATELGVSEAQLEALGSGPSQLLASVRSRGNPPECAPLVAHLAALP